MARNKKKMMAQTEAFKSLSENEKLNFLVYLDEALEKIRYRESTVGNGFSTIMDKLNSLN